MSTSSQASTIVDPELTPPPPEQPPPEQPPLDQPQLPRPQVEPVNIRRRDLAAVLAVGVACDLAVRRPPGANVAGTLLFTTIALGFFVTGRATTPFVRRSLAAAIGFAVMLSVRTDPRLVAFNLLASAGLLVLAAAPPERWFDTRPIQGLRNAVMALAVAIGFMVEVPRQARAHQRRASEAGAARHVLAVGRGLLLALPIVVVIASLLASADAVFASFFDSVPFHALDSAGHAALIAMGSIGMALLFRLRATTTERSDTPSAPRLGRTEAIVTLALLDVLFLVFAVAQVVARVDVDNSTVLDHALADRGLTYKEHARQGFFQLLWVAAITMTVLLSLRSMIGETARTTRGFRVPALLAVALTYLIIAVAFTRLQLYIGDNGLTPLRFYSSVFSVWIGVGFAMVSLRLLEWRPDRAWMLPALVTSGLTTLAGLDLANPEAIIARDALARNERSVLWHVDKLSGDGIAVLVDGMGTLDPDLQIELSDTLCSVALGRRGDLIDGGDGFLDWNVGRSRGRDAVVELCAFDR